MNTQTTAILEKIREVCPELTCDCQQGHVPLGMSDDGEVVWDACPFCVDHDRDPMYIPELKTAHLEHLLRTIPEACTSITAHGIFGDVEKGSYGICYDLTKSVRDNLETNPELREFIYRLICE